MSQRWLLLLLVSAVLAPAQQIPTNVVLVGDPEPEDTRLYRYYGQENRDSTWSYRLALLLSAIQKDPTASFLSSPETYFGIPNSLRDQVKQSWIIQVQQHPDNARVLRNAALALDPTPPPPPPPPFTSSVPPPNQIRVGGNVQAANILTKVQPEYPASARQAGIQGTVRFSATISPDGRISTLTLMSGHPLLVGSATQAVQQWTYKPTLLNGNPVGVITTIDVTFTLVP